MLVESTWRGAKELKLLLFQKPRSLLYSPLPLEMYSVGGQTKVRVCYTILKLELHSNTGLRQTGDIIASLSLNILVSCLSDIPAALLSRSDKVVRLPSFPCS